MKKEILLSFELTCQPRPSVSELCRNCWYTSCSLRSASSARRAGPSTSSAFAEDFQELSVTELAELPDDQLAKIDIAVLNLKCADGLAGSEKLDIPKTVAVLDAWAKRIGTETQRYSRLYQQNPAQFQNSLNFFKIQMMVTVIMQDFRCGCNPERDATPDQPQPFEEFYTDSRDVFLNGFTDRSTPLGTCASFPVLYVALGRRLEYPLKLVTARGHLFCRWEDDSEIFNIEGTNSGMTSHVDSYYRKWPMPITDADIKANGYLHSMTPKQELAAFMASRGFCHLASKDFPSAKASYDLATSLSPDVELYSRYSNAAHLRAQKATPTDPESISKNR